MPSDVYDTWMSTALQTDVHKRASQPQASSAGTNGPEQSALDVGPVRITEEGLGPPVGPGPGADTLYAFMAEDGSGPVDKKALPTAAALNERGRAGQAA